MSATEKPKKRFNQNDIRMSVMSRLFVEHYKRTGLDIEGSSTLGCQRWKKYTAVNQRSAEIAVGFKNSGLTSKMHEHFMCNNYKFCPHCARAGAAKMRDFISDIFISSVEQKKMGLAMMTLTAAHTRDCDWKLDIVDPFFKAVKLFSRRMGKVYKSIGCLGQFRAMESPVGPNGLHVHLHDELVYKPGADLAKFETTARQKWMDACKEVGLKCNTHGLHLTTDFEPHYIAKDETKKEESKKTAFELAAFDTKTQGKNKTLFQLLDAAGRGDKQAGDDYIRACIALQGRARWNIGQLAKKLGIPAPSQWRKSEGTATAEKTAPHVIIEYPIEDHLVATTPGQKRASLALLLRAARQKQGPGSIERMVKALCDEIINLQIQKIRQKYAKRLAKRLDKLWAEEIHESVKHTIKNAILASEFKWMNAAIAECKERRQMLNPEYAKQQREGWEPLPRDGAPCTALPADTANLVPGLELDFS